MLRVFCQGGNFNAIRHKSLCKVEMLGYEYFFRVEMLRYNDFFQGGNATSQVFFQGGNATSRVLFHGGNAMSQVFFAAWKCYVTNISSGCKCDVKYFFRVGPRPCVTSIFSG